MHCGTWICADCRKNSIANRNNISNSQKSSKPNWNQCVTAKYHLSSLLFFAVTSASFTSASAEFNFTGSSCSHTHAHTHVFWTQIRKYSDAYRFFVWAAAAVAGVVIVAAVVVVALAINNILISCFFWNNFQRVIFSRRWAYNSFVVVYFCAPAGGPMKNRRIERMKLVVECVRGIEWGELQRVQNPGRDPNFFLALGLEMKLFP